MNETEKLLTYAVKHIAALLEAGCDVEVRKTKDGITIHEVKRKVVRKELHKDA